MLGQVTGWLAVGFSDNPDIVRIFLGTQHDVLNGLIVCHFLLPKVGRNMYIYNL